MLDVVVKGYKTNWKTKSQDGTLNIHGVRGFLEDIHSRKPHHHSKKQAESNDQYPDVLDKWFEKLADLYETSNLTDYDAAERIWNCDETGFCIYCHSNKKYASKKRFQEYS